MILKGITIDKDVLTTKFACDYSVCKGACCHIPSDVEGFEGCEITEEEEKFIRKNKKLLAELVTGEGHELVLTKPTYRHNGERFVSLMKGGQCCLECNGHCVLGTAKYKGLLDYGNPIACGLYPLVLEVNHLSVGHYYDELGCCKCGYEKGTRDNIYLVEFCKDSIIKALGEDFYKELIRFLR